MPNAAAQRRICQTVRSTAAPTDVCFLPPLQLESVTSPLTPLLPILLNFSSSLVVPSLDAVLCVRWPSATILGSGQTELLRNVPVFNSRPSGPQHGSTSPSLTARGLSFSSRVRGASRQLSHIIPTVSAAFISAVKPWAKATGLMMCTCEAHLRISPACALLRHSASVTAGHLAQLRVLWMHSSPQPALHLSSPTNSTWEL